MIASEGVFADDNTFALGQSRSFHDDRLVACGDVVLGKLKVVEGSGVSRWDRVLSHELFGESLVGFELGGFRPGAEDSEAGVLEFVDDTGRERILGPDDGEFDFLPLGDCDCLLDVVWVAGDIGAQLRGSGVSREHEELSK